MEPNFAGNVWPKIHFKKHAAWHAIGNDLPPWRIITILIQGSKAYYSQKGQSMNFKKVFGKSTVAEAIIAVQMYWIPLLSLEQMILLKKGKYITDQEQDFLLALFELKKMSAHMKRADKFNLFAQANLWKRHFPKNDNHRRASRMSS